MTMEAAARALGALERNPAVCVQLLAPLKRMTALQVSVRAVVTMLQTMSLQPAQGGHACCLPYTFSPDTVPAR